MAGCVVLLLVVHLSALFRKGNVPSFSTFLISRHDALNLPRIHVRPTVIFDSSAWRGDIMEFSYVAAYSVLLQISVEHNEFNVFDRETSYCVTKVWNKALCQTLHGLLTHIVFLLDPSPLLVPLDYTFLKFHFLYDIAFIFLVCVLFVLRHFAISLSRIR